MKKRIFMLALMVALIVCALTVVASAATPNNDGEVFVAADETTLALYDTEGKALAWFYDSTTSQYVPYRVGIDFTISLNSSRELLPTSAIADTDGDDSTTFPYAVSDMILLNGRDYSAFTYISGTWSSMPLQAIYVNNTFRWINKQAFNNNNTLKVFDIPKDHSGSLHIGAAFVRANALESFYIPKGATFESTSTFEYSTGIKSVEFHDEWEGTLKGYEFNGCTALETVKLASSTTSIPQRVFYNCSALKSVTFGNALETIGNEAFGGCKLLTTLSPMPSTLKSVGTDAFKNCQSIVSLVFPKDCTVPLSKYQFENCYKLETLTIQATTSTEIGEGTFYNCTSLKNLKLPLSGITSIGTKAFRNTGLEFLDLGDATGVTSLPNHVFADNGKLKILVLPPNVTSLGNYCLEKCTSLAEVWMPSVTAITFTQQAFGQCGSDLAVNFYFPAESCTITFSNATNNKDPFMTAYNGGSTKATISYNVPLTTKCEKIYLGHTKPENITSCLVGGNCSVCSTAFEPYATEHTKGGETLTFPNGLTANGIYTYDCTNPGCTIADILVGDKDGRDVVAPVFTAKGYSTNADKNAINGGYSVDLDSLALYERLIGELNYGIVIANANSFGANSFFNAENKVNTDKALQVEMDKQYASFDCSINFGTKTNIELDLVICAYVIDANGVTFIQAESGSDVTIGAKGFKSVTLAQVVALQPAVSKED